MLMATGFEGRIEDSMGLGMLEEGEAGRDGREVGGRRLGCACSASRAGQRAGNIRPMFPLPVGGYPLPRRIFGELPP
jgi:hypothetical protein